MHVERLLDIMESVDPLKEPYEFARRIWKYLKPYQERPAPRAHLFTINGLTYPIQRDFGFAAVPDPTEITKEKFTPQRFIQRSKRRYSMLAYLFSTRPGDLVFFFQADPQYPKDIWNRRGFRGIWMVASEPFRDLTDIKHPKTGYEILGKCPHCGSPFDFGEGGLVGGSKKCLLCGGEYGWVALGNKRYSKVVLSARLLIKPLKVFKKTAGDNRVYSDLTISPLIWISRADNAMGPGKGSSIRTLLPEEAAKIAYMLATENDQVIENVQVQTYPGTKQDIRDYNNKPSRLLRAIRERQGRRWVLEHELHLNLYFAMNIDNPDGPIQRALNLPLREVEWWTTEFPWGYTGDAADFTLTLWNDSRGRYAIYIFEFKKDIVDTQALAEVLLYVPWVAQVLASPELSPDVVEAYPVLVGRENKLKYIPDEYSLDLTYMAVPAFNAALKGKKKIVVKPPTVLLYEIRDEDCAEIMKMDSKRKESVCYVGNLSLTKIDIPTRTFKPPPPTFTTTEVEKSYVAKKHLQGF
jgi:hypothetical protein